MEIRELLSHLGIPVAPDGHHHTTTGRVQIDCPHCSPGSGRWRMGLRENKSHWCTCWTCGPHKTAETLVMASNQSYKEVNALLGTLPFDLTFATRPAGGKLARPGLVGELQRPHRNFIQGRSISASMTKRLWKVRGIGFAPHLAWSIYIPIFFNGEEVSWTTRGIYGDGRYTSAKPEQEKISHKTLLYGEDYCVNTVAVVEGPVDVWALGPGAVCTFGTAYTTEQLMRIAKYPRRVICFDNEPDAQRAARQLVTDLKGFDGETVNVVMETGKDASRSSKKEREEFRVRFLESTPSSI